jgi:Ca2+:H+ antiporter
MPAKNEGNGWFRFGMLRPLDWFLLALPAAFVIHLIGARNNETLLFFTAGTAIVPLAAWLSRATEHLSCRKTSWLSARRS